MQHTFKISHFSCLHHKNPQRPTYLPVQPVSNPNNNKIGQPIYNTDIQMIPTYFITSVPLLGVQLRSERNLQPNSSTVTIEEPEEAQSDEDLGEKEKETISRIQPNIETGKVQAPKNPPYLERLAIEKPIVSP